MRRLSRQFILLTTMLVASTWVPQAQAATVTLFDLFAGGTITANDKLFDSWKLNKLTPVTVD